jgi:hypothetical protein
MSLTKATYSMIQGAPINVLDFGAVGDNVADDTAALQAVFDAVPIGGCIEFPPNKTFKTTASIVMPRTTWGVVIQGNGSTIRAYHDGNGVELTSLNENYSRFSVYNLTIQGPNVSFPNNPTELAGTSTGAALKMGYDDTSNTPGGYLCTFVNCTFRNFYQGVYLQAVLLCNFIGGSAFFNQYGMYFDGGQTNANTFRTFSVRQNRIAGCFSSGRTDGALTDATANAFYSCIFESNVPYDLSAGGYPAAFDATKGYGVHLKQNFNWVFNACYFENQNYAIVIDDSSDSNSFYDCYFASGGGGVQVGGIIVKGASAANNMFHGLFMNTGTAENFFIEVPASSIYNQIINCSGVVFGSGTLDKNTYIQNSRGSQGSSLGDLYGAIQLPPQGYVDSAVEGTNRGRINGIGTATATLNMFGVGEVQFSGGITAATTITTITGQRAGQFLVLRNYQDSFAVTLKASADGTGAIVLTGNADVVFNDFGQQIVLYVTSGLGGSRCYEVGRNF